MSDLVKRLQHHDEYEPLGHDGWEAADRIEQLERELAKVQHERNHMVEAHAAEKALAEDIFEVWRVGVEFNPNITLAAYRKARGM